MVIEVIVAVIAHILMGTFYLVKLIKIRTEVKKNNDHQNSNISTSMNGKWRITITKLNFKKACMWGGSIAGFFGSILILLLYISHNKDLAGYPKLDPEQFKLQVIMLVFLFQILLGTFLGWLCGNFSTKIESTNKRHLNRIFYLSFIFIIGFLSIFFLRQLMARDALILPNKHYSGINEFSELNNGKPCKIDADFLALYKENKDTSWHVKYIRPGGGYLGEPDFESLATGLAGAIVFLILVLRLSKLFKPGHSKNKILSLKGIILITLQAAFLGFVCWIAVYGIYLILIRNCILSKFGVIYARWVFTFDFPNPQRFLLVFLLCALYLFSFFFMIRMFSVSKMIVKKTKNEITENTKEEGSN